MGRRIVGFLKYALAFGLGGGLLYLALNNLTWSALLAALYKVRPEMLLLSLGCMVLAHLCRALRWQQLLAAAGQRVSASHSFWALMLGYLVNYAVPRLGEVTRCGILNRSDRVAVPAAIGTVLNERLLDLIVFALLLTSVLLIEADAIARLLAGGDLLARVPGWNLVIAALVFVVFVGVLLWLLRKKLLQLALVKKILVFVQSLAQAMLSIRRMARPVLFVLYTVGIWVGYWLSSYFGLLALGSATPYSPYFGYLLLTLTTIAMVLPTPGGIGAYQYAVIQAFALYNLPQLDAQVFGVLSQAAQVLVNIAIGIVGYGVLLAASQRLVRAQAKA